MRTIVEFNHDLAHKIETDPDGFVEVIKRMLNSGFTSGPAGRSDVGDDLRAYGITATPTTHHSVDRKVVLGDFHTTEF